MTDSYQKVIEDKKISEENLLEEVGKTNVFENLLCWNFIFVSILREKQYFWIMIFKKI